MEKQLDLANPEIGRPVFERIQNEFSKVIIGQEDLVDKILIGLLTGGHILLEGVPGLAKTLAVKTLATISGMDFSRIQFTPDLLPADIIGTEIYNQKTNEFSTKKGPIFSNLILADEINRAPSKVQAALLEAMQEKQVTIGEKSYKLPDTYLVLATQNPIEQEGTYPLPEAQVDRFMLKVVVGYPTKKQEKEIALNFMNGQNVSVHKALQVKELKAIRNEIHKVYVDEKLIDYIVDIVFATREPEKVGLDKSLISHGASPRATIFLTQAAKAYAYLQGENYVKTEDIQSIVVDILRHRITLSYEAEAEGLSSEGLIKKIIANITTP